VLYGVKTVIKYLLGTDKANRNFAVFPDDTFLVSYPRSGNTWTRFLIANLVYPKIPVSFANIEKLIPDSASQSSRALKRTPRPRIIKTHQYFDHRYPKTIYIVRDPRDIALSYYDFQRRSRQIDDDYDLERHVDDFVSGRLNSADWGTWAENVASWVYTRGQRKEFLLVRYEDMIKDTSSELARIAIFLGMEPAPAELQQAIELSSADRMRKLEKLEAHQWVGTRNHRKDIPFVGKARSGGWRTSLSRHSIQRIESAWGELMTVLGYELVTANSTMATLAMSRRIR
jgi:hypothetical protein